jgi:hypothetical protein
MKPWLAFHRVLVFLLKIELFFMSICLFLYLGHSSLTFAGLTVVFWILLHSVPLSTQNRAVWQFRLWRTFPLILFLGTGMTSRCFVIFISFNSIISHLGCFRKDKRLLA